MDQPLLTVLMPVYNAEKYLAEAMDSILAQTLENFEFLIIDDGSKDRSIDIIRSYNDPRIRIIQNETNLGISKTLNKGIGLATAELIARMDADDISYPERLKKQFDYFTNHPDCALLSTWAKMITEDKQHIRTEKYKSRFYYYNLTFECWMFHPTVMYSKAAAMKVGCYSVPYAEDFELFWQLSRKFRIHNLEEVLVDYRITSQSLHQVTRKKEYDEAMDEQILRNIHYFTGDDFSINWEEIECLRFNFIPLMQQGSVNAIVECLRKLEYINKCIFVTPNVNFILHDLKEAAYFKKEYIIRYFRRNLPKRASAQLMIRLTTKRHFWRMVKNHSLRRVRRFLRSFK